MGTPPSSDLALILSQYRVMTYHNLETGQDEGIVFVKKDEDASTGELIRWTGHGATDPSNNSSQSATSSTAVSSSSTTPRVILPSTRSSGAETSPSTSQRSYEKSREERNDCVTGVEGDQIDKEKIKSLNSGRGMSRLKLQKKSSVKSGPVSAAVGTNQDVSKGMPSSQTTSFLHPTSCSNKPTEAANNSTKDNEKVKASSKRMCKLPLPIPSEPTMSGSSSSPIKQKVTAESVYEPVSSLLREKNLKRLMIAGNSGWVREVVKGDRRSVDSNKIRITYLPPKSPSYMRKRVFTFRQLTTFLETHCKDTNLTKDNFSFSPRVFGLGLPWEIVRHANENVSKRSKKKACLPPGDNKGMGSQLEGVNYSPMQHAKPLKPKQKTPFRNNKVKKMRRTGSAEGKGRDKPKPLVLESKNRNVAKDVEALKLKDGIRNVKDPMKKNTQIVSRAAVSDGDKAQEKTPPKEVTAKSLQNFTKLNIREDKKLSPVVSLAGPETMDLPDIEIVGYNSGLNNNYTVVSHSKLEGSSSCLIDYDSDFQGTGARDLYCEGAGVAGNSFIPASSISSNHASGQQSGPRRDSVIRSTESETLSLSKLPDCISVSRLSLN